MPYLGDYLGHLLAEITLARVQADLEAIRVAELYAGDPLLRNMPVPRFRLPTLTVEVPVAIGEVGEASREQPASQSAPPLRQSFDRLLEAHLEMASVQLSEEQKLEVGRALDQAIGHFTPNRDLTPTAATAAEELTAAVVRALRRPARGETLAEPPWLDQLARDLRAAARREFVRIEPARPRIHVLATAGELREAGPPERLTRIRLSISEEAYEWTEVETGGKTHDRLVPE